MGQSHFISNITIGPADGKLYVHVGDGFDASTAQNMDRFRGKILRLNLDGTAPTDNPFFNAGDGINARDYVFASGVRNPFGGTWRQSDGQHYMVENGPSVDRLAKIVAGRNYLWDGSNPSMFNFASYNWDPSHAPVNMLFVQENTFLGNGFPGAKLDRLFVSESGPTYASGPQALGKRITEFVLDANGNRIAGPVDFVTYTGSGKGTIVALAAGPDGIYFSELYKDQNFTSPIDRGARIFRVRWTGAPAPSVAVTPRITNDRTPALAGTISHPSAIVRVKINGFTYAAANNGNGTWTLPDGAIAPPLPDGAYDVRVTATHNDVPIGVDTTTNELVIDGTPPTVNTADFLFDSPIVPGRAHTVDLVFSEDVGSTLASADLQLTNITTQTPINPADVEMSYDPQTRRARFTFANRPAGALEDGNYTATIAAGAVTDPAGNTLANPLTFSFFVFSGDANRDRSINVGDFAVVASHFNSPGTYSAGDFDYSGVVNILDFSLLASKFNISLPVARRIEGGLSSRRATVFASGSLIRMLDDEFELKANLRNGAGDFPARKILHSR
jgi:hypothetical protein